MGAPPNVPRPLEQLRRDALAIWRAGVDAVLADRLVREAVHLEGDELRVRDQAVAHLAQIDRIVVVGGGKATAGMAAGLEAALGPRWLEAKQLTGWVNVPEDCIIPLRRIHLHPARPPGRNEPTPQAVEGTLRILQMVEQLGPRDLCIALISGGGSALLPAPAPGITLDDKLAVTRFLSAAGANIEQLNTVRKQLSRIKGGGLARACRAGRLVALIISDVMGDRLDIIASGPTVPDRSTPDEALAILRRFGAERAGIPQRVFDFLSSQRSRSRSSITCQVKNFIIGNNATAVDAAGREAVARGYQYVLQSATASEGPAEQVAQHLADQALRMRQLGGADCLISGGEPTVQLAPADQRGLGGRNQQLALAALVHLEARLEHLLLLSGGTDGEDGPTDAAGAWVDAAVRAEALQRGLDPRDYLRRNDAYHFFEPLGALIKTGPTQTNVGDLRVVLLDSAGDPPSAR